MNFNDLVAKSVIQIKESNEFFGALMLFSEFKSSKDIPTAATDGKKVFINEKFFNSLNSSNKTAYCFMRFYTWHFYTFHVWELEI